VSTEAGSILLTVAYDGAPYAGFAAQPGQVTVAGALLEAIARLDPSVRRLRVASRTDAGVHARDNRVAFDPERALPTRAWVLGLERHLPESVVVSRASRVERGFEPRRHTLEKRYRYLVLCRRAADPFLAGRAWHIWGVDDDARLARMQRELDAAVGTHDFSAFASARDPRGHRMRTLTTLTVRRLDRWLVAIDVTGDGFLHNMVRILVGTAVEVGLDRRPEGTLARALASGDRRLAGMTAPPDGLYLETLAFADEGCDPWPPRSERDAASAAG
jgi:tRNA pseudouridine38-40 synthase